MINAPMLAAVEGIIADIDQFLPESSNNERQFAAASAAMLCEAVVHMIAKSWEQMRSDDDNDTLNFIIAVKQDVETEGRVKLDAKLSYTVKRASEFSGDESLNGSQMELVFAEDRPDPTEPNTGEILSGSLADERPLSVELHVVPSEAPAKKKRRKKSTASQGE